MQWRLEEIIAFLHLVETENITEAARRLTLSKSVIHKRIMDLEAASHRQLLRPSIRRVSATEQGRALYAPHRCEHRVHEVAVPLALPGPTLH